MYVTTHGGTTRWKPIASNWSHAIVPFVSVRSAWSTVRPISSPATGLPDARCDSMSFRVRLLPTFVHRDECAPLRADVLAARADEPVVVVLLEDVRRPACDASRRDHGREEIHGDAERVEEGRRVEVHVRDEPLGGVDARVELDGHL